MCLFACRQLTASLKIMVEEFSIGKISPNPFTHQYMYRVAAQATPTIGNRSGNFDHKKNSLVQKLHPYISKKYYLIKSLS